MSRLSADPAAMARETQALREVADGLDRSRSAVARALGQLAGGCGSGPVAAAADDAARRWAAALGRQSATAGDLGTRVERAGTCYRQAERASTTVAGGSW